MSNLSTRTRKVIHNKIKKYNTQSNTLLKDAQIKSIVNKVIQLPLKPTSPEHVAKAISGELREHWIDTVFGEIDKMHNTGT